jgi:predicted negative regulator of RcsB-dependent stress response
MINKKKQNIFTNRITLIFKNNFKPIIFLFLALFLIIIFFQYYLYQKNNKVLKLSVLYEQAKANVNSSDFEESMNLIIEENGIFRILASLELIKKRLNNKDYSFAFNEYLKLLKKNELNRTYTNIIALHGAYNLIDYVPTDNILILLTFIDESSTHFVGYKDEIKYLLSIKNSDLNLREELAKKILNNGNISETIKERVRKINEFEKYQ